MKRIWISLKCPPDIWGKKGKTGGDWKKVHAEGVTNTPVNHYGYDYIKDDEKGQKCGTYGEEVKYIQASDGKT
jgi:hypothetical protein